MRSFLIFWSLFALLIDQTSKFLIKKIPDQGIFFVKTEDWTIGWQKHLNTDLALSLGSNIPIINFGLIIISLGLLIGLIVKYKTKNKIVIPLLIILGSALSNLLDRLILGGVLDFAVLSRDNLHFPIFNISDILIVGSFAYLLIFKRKSL
ncbi:MAG: signal peptidase II [Patescibacteria group bacterium]